MERVENIKTNTINKAIETIESEDLKQFVIDLFAEVVPPYYFKVPASSSLKYHNRFAIQEGGLVYHTLSLVRILNYFFEIECMQNNYTPRERDLLRIAGLMHDTFKSGTQEEYEQASHTKFEHPLIAATKIYNYYENNYLKYLSIKEEEIQLLCCVIRTHMGSWNTSQYSDVVLPKPHTKYETLLHMCDYLASRKDIEVIL